MYHEYIDSSIEEGEEDLTLLYHTNIRKRSSPTPTPFRYLRLE